MSYVSKKSPYRILVVDDNQSIHDDFKKIFLDINEQDDIKLLDKIMLDENYQSTSIDSSFCIDSAYSGREGLKFIKKSIQSKNPYAIAFVDVRMPPGWDGIETASQIFQVEPNIQVIICSAYSDYSWKDMLNKIHHGDRWLLLKKPFDITEVRQMVLSLCEKWLLELDIKNQIKEKTQKLEEANKKLEIQIKKLISAKEEIKYLAYYDTLSGLPNRFFFREMLEQDILEAKRKKNYISLFFLDLDDFKKINDTFGHASGDDLLRQVAIRLTNFLRESDFVGRYDQVDNLFSISSARLGGDEFTVIIKNFNDPEELRRIAGRILKLISTPFYKILDEEVKITASVGVAVYPTDGEDFGTLVKHADMAMYQAKAMGKSKFNFYDKVLYHKITKKNLLEQDIHKALSREELFLLYQPKINISNDLIIGSEALLRWNHPIKGLLTPDQFIPIAEESDLILDIDTWVIKEACQQITGWNKFDFLKDIIVSINISGRLFNHPDLINMLSDIIKHKEIDSQSLELEITESMLMNTDEDTINRLRDLRNLLKHGIKISVDDFGTGYSSLNYLGVLPLDTLKIAQSFIDKIGFDVSQKSIIKAIIDLSHNLNLNVIAEGVETQRQLDFLKKSGCDEIQGYFLAKPMAPNKFIEFVKNWNSHKNKA